eukprot:PhF_6_TR1939/c0_g1_i1/m.3052
MDLSPDFTTPNTQGNVKGKSRTGAHHAPDDVTPSSKDSKAFQPTPPKSDPRNLPLVRLLRDDLDIDILDLLKPPRSASHTVRNPHPPPHKVSVSTTTPQKPTTAVCSSSSSSTRRKTTAARHCVESSPNATCTLPKDDTVNSFTLAQLESLNARREKYTSGTIDLSPVQVNAVAPLIIENGVYEMTTMLMISPGNLGLACALLVHDDRITELDCSQGTFDTFSTHAILSTIQRNENIIKFTIDEDCTNIRPADLKLLRGAAQRNFDQKQLKDAAKLQALTLKREAARRKQEKEENTRLKKLSLVHRHQQDVLFMQEAKTRNVILTNAVEKWSTLTTNAAIEKENAWKATIQRLESELAARDAVESQEVSSRHSIMTSESHVGSSLRRKWTETYNAISTKEKEREVKRAEERKQLSIQEMEARSKVRLAREASWKECMNDWDVSFKQIRKIEQARKQAQMEKEMEEFRRENEKLLFYQRCVQQRDNMDNEERYKRNTISNEWSSQCDAITRSMRASAEDAAKKYSVRRSREAKEAEISRIESKVPKLTFRFEDTSSHTFLYPMNWEGIAMPFFPSTRVGIDLEHSRELTSFMKRKKTEVMGGRCVIYVKDTDSITRPGDELVLLCNYLEEPLHNFNDDALIEQGSGSLEASMNFTPPHSPVSFRRKPILSPLSRYDNVLYYEDAPIAEIIPEETNSTMLTIELRRHIKLLVVEALVAGVAYSNTALYGHGVDWEHMNFTINVGFKLSISVRQTSTSDALNPRPLMAELVSTGKLTRPLVTLFDQKEMIPVEYLEDTPPVRLMPAFCVHLDGITYSTTHPPPDIDISEDDSPPIPSYELVVRCLDNLTKDDRIRIITENSDVSLIKMDSSHGYHVMYHHHFIGRLDGYDANPAAMNADLKFTFGTAQYVTLRALYHVLRTLHFQCVSDTPSELTRIIDLVLQSSRKANPCRVRCCVKVIPVEDPLVVNLVPLKEPIFRIPNACPENMVQYYPFDTLTITPFAVVTDLDIGLFTGAFLEVVLVDAAPGDCLGFECKEGSLFSVDAATGAIVFLETQTVIANIVEGFYKFGPCRPTEIFSFPKLRINFVHGSQPSFGDNSGLQHMFRSVCFFTTGAKRGVRNVSYTLFLGEHDNPLGHRRYDPSVPVVLSASLLVGDPIVSLSASASHSFVYREGSGPVNIAQFMVQEELSATYRSFDGGYLQATLLEGHTDGEDTLQIRTMEDYFAFIDKPVLTTPNSTNEWTFGDLRSVTTVVAFSSLPTSRRTWNELKQEVAVNTETERDRQGAAIANKMKAPVTTAVNASECTNLGSYQANASGCLMVFVGKDALPNVSPTMGSGSPSYRRRMTRKDIQRVLGNTKASEFTPALIRRKDLIYLLRHIAFECTSDDPKCLRKVVLVTVSDGHYSRSHVAIEIVIQPVDDVTEVQRKKNDPVPYRQGSAWDETNGVIVFGDCTLHDPDSFEFYGGYLHAAIDGGGFGGFDLIQFLPKEVQLNDPNRKFIFEEQVEVSTPTSVTSKIILIAKQEETADGDAPALVACHELVGSATYDASDKCFPFWRILFATNTASNVANININLATEVMRCITYKNVAPPMKLKAAARVFALLVNPGPPSQDGKFKLTVNVTPPLIYILDRAATVKFRQKQDPVPLFGKIQFTLADTFSFKAGFLRVELKDADPADELINPEVFPMGSTSKKGYVITTKGYLMAGKDVVLGLLKTFDSHVFEMVFDASCKACTMKTLIAFIRCFSFVNRAHVLDPAPRKALLTLSDSDVVNSNTCTVTIQTETIDDETEVNLNDFAPVYVRGGQPVPLAPAVTVVDADTQIFAAGAILCIEGSRSDVIAIPNKNKPNENGIWCDDQFVYFGAKCIGSYVMGPTSLTQQAPPPPPPAMTLGIFAQVSKAKNLFKRQSRAGLGNSRTSIAPLSPENLEPTSPTSPGGSSTTTSTKASSIRNIMSALRASPMPPPTPTSMDSPKPNTNNNNNTNTTNTLWAPTVIDTTREEMLSPEPMQSSQSQTLGAGGDGSPSSSTSKLNFAALMGVQKARNKLKKPDTSDNNSLAGSISVKKEILSTLTVRLNDCPIENLESLMQVITFQNDDNILEKVKSKDVRILVRGSSTVKPTKVTVTVEISPPVFEFLANPEFVFQPDKDCEIMNKAKFYAVPINATFTWAAPTQAFQSAYPFRFAFVPSEARGISMVKGSTIRLQDDPVGDFDVDHATGSCTIEFDQRQRKLTTADVQNIMKCVVLKNNGEGSSRFGSESSLPFGASLGRSGQTPKGAMKSPGGGGNSSFGRQSAVCTVKCELSDVAFTIESLTILY